MTTYAREANPRLVSAEIFTASVCNLECSYCYIPKNQEMIEYHRKILDALRNNTYVQILKDTFGDELEALGFWGTEPTLILNELAPKIKDYLEAFPKLVYIGFSSNFVSNIDSISNFVDALSLVADRQIKLSVQVSIDGPAWITDPGRGKGVTEKILKNVEKLLSNLKNSKSEYIQIEIIFKATVDNENIELMVQDKEKLVEWFNFFAELFEKNKKGLEEIKNIYVSSVNSMTPTLVVPGKYSTYDGKVLAEYFKELRRMGKEIREGRLEVFQPSAFSLNDYVLRFAELLNNFDDVIQSTTNTTCSGFDSQAGVDFNSYLVPCHRLFLFNDDKYIQTMVDQNIEEWEVSRASKNILQNIKKYFMPRSDKPKDVARYWYVSRGYHDFASFRYGATYNMIKELAAAGQASEIYLEDDYLTFLLAVFLNTRMSCPAENYLNTGSLHLNPVSLIRLFANGAFEEVLAEYFDATEYYENQKEENCYV